MNKNIRRELKSGGSGRRFNIGPCYGFRLESWDRSRFPVTVFIDGDESDQLKLDREQSFHYNTLHTFTAVSRDDDAQWLVTTVHHPDARIDDSVANIPVRIALYEKAAGTTLATGDIYDIRTGDSGADALAGSISTHRFSQQWVGAACGAIGGAAPVVRLQFNYTMGSEDSGGEHDERGAEQRYRTVNATLPNAPAVGSQLAIIRVADDNISAHANDTIAAAWSPYSSVTLSVAGGGANVTFTDGLRIEWWGQP